MGMAMINSAELIKIGFFFTGMNNHLCSFELLDLIL